GARDDPRGLVPLPRAVLAVERAHEALLPVGAVAARRDLRLCWVAAVVLVEVGLDVFVVAVRHREVEDRDAARGEDRENADAADREADRALRAAGVSTSVRRLVVLAGSAGRNVRRLLLRSVLELRELDAIGG